MKKIVSLLLLISLSLCLFGCSNFINNKTYKIPKSFTVTQDGITKTYECEWNFDNNTITTNYTSDESKSEAQVTDFKLRNNGLISQIGSMSFDYDNEGHLIEITDGSSKKMINWNENFTLATFEKRTIMFDNNGNPIKATGNNGWDELWSCYIDEYGNALKLRNYTKPIDQFANEASIDYDDNHNVISLAMVDDDKNSYQMKYNYVDGYCTQVELTNERINAVIDYTDVTENQYNAYKTLKDLECPYMSYYVFNIEFDYVLWTKAH